MPLQVFSCSRCGARFEELVKTGERAPCPECGTSRTRREPPRVAVGAKAPDPRASTAGCGTCGDPRGPGACRA